MNTKAEVEGPKGRMNEQSFVTTKRSPSKCTGSANARWSWSCTEDRDNPSNVRAVRLSDGNDDWNNKDNNRLGVLPFRVPELNAPFPILSSG